MRISSSFVQGEIRKRQKTSQDAKCSQYVFFTVRPPCVIFDGSDNKTEDSKMPFEKKDAAPHAGDWTTITKHLSLRMNIFSCRANLQEEILEEYFEEDKGRIKPKIR